MLVFFLLLPPAARAWGIGRVRLARVRSENVYAEGNQTLASYREAHERKKGPILLRGSVSLARRGVAPHRAARWERS